MFGIDDAIMGGLIGGGLSFLGGERRNQAQAAQAQQANTFSAQQFASRYQTTTKDMQAAGLNPMLAYSQGGGTPPSGQQASMDDTLTPAVSNFNVSKMNTAQVANVQADTANKSAQAELWRAQAAAANASAGQSKSQVDVNAQMVDKIKQETVNLVTENDKAKVVIDNLRQEGQNLFKQNLNLTEVGNHLRAMISEINARIPGINQQAILNELDAQLKRYDVQAAGDLGNIGREAGQVKPVFDILRNILRK